jgi:hypothetical protein
LAFLKSAWNCAISFLKAALKKEQNRIELTCIQSQPELYFGGRNDAGGSPKQTPHHQLPTHRRNLAQAKVGSILSKPRAASEQQLRSQEEGTVVAGSFPPDETPVAPERNNPEGESDALRNRKIHHAVR